MAEFYSSTLQAAFDNAWRPENLPKDRISDLFAKVHRTIPGKEVRSEAENNVL